MELTFTPMRPADIAPLTPIMKRAFDEDTRLHLGRPAGGPQGMPTAPSCGNGACTKRALPFASGMGAR